MLHVVPHGALACGAFALAIGALAAATCYGFSGGGRGVASEHAAGKAAAEGLLPMQRTSRQDSASEMAGAWGAAVRWCRQQQMSEGLPEWTPPPFHTPARPAAARTVAALHAVLSRVAWMWRALPHAPPARRRGTRPPIAPATQALPRGEAATAAALARTPSTELRGVGSPSASLSGQMAADTLRQRRVSAHEVLLQKV
jgi:hypothetical protein